MRVRLIAAACVVAVGATACGSDSANVTPSDPPAATDAVVLTDPIVTDPVTVTDPVVTDAVVVTDPLPTTAPPALAPRITEAEIATLEQQLDEIDDLLRGIEADLDAD